MTNHTADVSTDAVERMRITKDGRVLINDTINTSFQLYVGGATGIGAEKITCDVLDVNTINYSTQNVFNHTTAGHTVPGHLEVNATIQVHGTGMFYDEINGSNAYVGINTKTPYKRLHIRGDRVATGALTSAEASE